MLNNHKGTCFKPSYRGLLSIHAHQSLMALRTSRILRYSEQARSHIKKKPPTADTMMAISLHGTDIAHQDDVAAVVNDKPPTTLLAV